MVKKIQILDTTVSRQDLEMIELYKSMILVNRFQQTPNMHYVFPHTPNRQQATLNKHEKPFQMNVYHSKELKTLLQKEIIQFLLLSQCYVFRSRMLQKRQKASRVEKGYLYDLETL